MTDHDPDEHRWADDGGFFANEQEAIAERLAWEDQTSTGTRHSGDEVVPGAGAGVWQGTEAGADLVPAGASLAKGGGSTATEEGVDPPLDPLDIPDKYDLPMYGQVQACPKCGMQEGWEVAYHRMGQLGAPCGETFGWPDVQGLGEHLCMRCMRCQYGLPMAVQY